MSGESSMTNMLDLMQKMWNPLNIPMPSMMTPTLNPAEVEKKIADLKAVENWLSMNLNMLQMTIQTLEMQKSGLEAIRASAEAVRTSAEAMKTGSTPPAPPKS